VLINGSSLNPERPDEGTTVAVLDLSAYKKAHARARESERLAHAVLDALATSTRWRPTSPSSIITA